MSERDDERTASKGGRSGYRASAHDDPHGTRAVAMALSSKTRGQLADPGTKPKVWVVLMTQWAFQLAFLLVMLGQSWVYGIPLVGVVLLLLGYRGHGGGSRLQVTERELVVTRGARHEAFPWAIVESLHVNLVGARATIRVGDALKTRRAFRNIFDRAREPEGSLIPTPVRELAGGARRSVATVFGSIGVVVFSIALGMALAMQADSGQWAAIGVAALCYLFVSLGITYRSQLTAKADGLHLPHRVIPWLAIEEAAPKDGAGSSEVRIRVVGEDEVTVFCGDANTAVTEILERRDLARRLREERDR